MDETAWKTHPLASDDQQRLQPAGPERVESNLATMQSAEFVECAEAFLRCWSVRCVGLSVCRNE